MLLVDGGGRKCKLNAGSQHAVCQGLWDQVKDCYAGALRSLVGSASRHTLDLHNPSSAINLIHTFIAILSAWPCLKSPGACHSGRKERRW
jgi:hypothetical protein